MNNGRLRVRLRSRVRGRWLGLALVFFAPAMLQAQATMGATADVRVTIDNTSGSITVTAWDRNEVSVLGSRSVLRDLEIDATPQSVQLKMQAGHYLEVKVPRGAQLRAKSVSGFVRVEGVEGSVDIESASGTLQVTGTPRSIHARGFSGGVSIFGGGTEVTRAESISGSVIITRANGIVEARSASGGVNVKGSVKDAQLFSVSGTVSFDGSVERSGKLTAESSSGAVELIVPRNMPADYELSTITADIDNEFGPPATKARGAAGVAVKFSTGNGGARIKGASVSGSIRLSDR